MFGGVDKEGQKKALASKQKSSDGKTLHTAMIAGTPGRILDLVSEGACDLSGYAFLQTSALFIYLRESTESTTSF